MLSFQMLQYVKSTKKLISANSMVSRFTLWEQAVKKRREAIQRTLRKIRRMRSGLAKRRALREVDDMMYYGVMDRHKRHWHKIDGVWFMDSVRTRQLRKRT